MHDTDISDVGLDVVPAAGSLAAQLHRLQRATRRCRPVRHLAKYNILNLSSQARVAVLEVLEKTTFAHLRLASSRWMAIQTSHNIDYARTKSRHPMYVAKYFS